MNCVRAVASVVAIMGCAGPAFADLIAVYTDGPGNTQGGIYHAETSGHGNFDTFCMEVREGMTVGFSFEYTISTEMMFNGDGTTNPLDAESAFIFTKFVQGEIRDILGNPSLPEDKMADAIQLALWMIEDQGDTTNANALTLIGAAEDAIGDGSWSGLGNVRVMNNWVIGHVGEQAFAKQDTLVLVPAGSTAIAAGVGAMILACRRRRTG